MSSSNDDTSTLQAFLDHQEDDIENSDRLFHTLIAQNQQIRAALTEILAIMAERFASMFAPTKCILYHTSILTGQMWVDELLNGHPDRIRSELSVRKHVFKHLVEELVAQGVVGSRNITLEEQLAIFLYTCVTGLSFRHVAECFQHSVTTISKYFRIMAESFAFTPIYVKYVKLPRSDDPILTRISTNPTVYPFFKDAIGAIDGTHITCTPSAADRDATRNRKGFHSQNCLVACNFDLEFLYVMSGWEGSMADASVYHDARITDFTIPTGKYHQQNDLWLDRHWFTLVACQYKLWQKGCSADDYLADAGYLICPQLLVPYRGTRYHLPEWDRSEIRPSNAEEYFNFHHAQLRNVVERIIGVLKRRFRILVVPPSFKMNDQAKIPPALCCIHNIIRKYDPDEFSELEREEQMVECPADRAMVYGTLANGFITPTERDHMSEKWEEIAGMLWADHNQYLRSNPRMTSNV